MFEESIYEQKILVVDDEQVNVEILEMSLKKAGFMEVYSTNNPFQAVRLYRENEFDLVLLDISMPEMDGFEVMEQFKSIKGNNDIPILVLTALTDEKTRLRALTAGARDFLTKPFNRNEALARIHNLLEMRFAQKRLSNYNAILEDTVRKRTLELHDTRLEIIRRLGTAAEYRDNETGLHIMRMSLTCHLLGKAIGMNDVEADLLLNASPMHDIGKIGIPDKILQKSGSLEKEEWGIMKTHTTIGAEIIAGHPSELLQSARVIALTHHEKWNGTGYPQRLAGEEIPLAGRISALADVFDALTSKRPYKEPWSFEASTAMIKENSGKQFDPKLVEAFIRILPEIQKIKTKYKEAQNGY